MFFVGSQIETGQYEQVPQNQITYSCEHVVVEFCLDFEAPPISYNMKIN